MASEKQIAANRRNALKSTGPRTPEGKAAVRLNALRHGLRARTVVLPGEDRAEFHQLCEDLEREWQPLTRTEQFYLEQMAVAQWKLTRMEAGEIDLCANTQEPGIQIPLLGRLWKAQSRLERAFARAQRELEHIQTLRAQQPEAEEESVIDGETAFPPPLEPVNEPLVTTCSAQAALRSNAADKTVELASETPDAATLNQNHLAKMRCVSETRASASVSSHPATNSLDLAQPPAHRYTESQLWAKTSVTAFGAL